MNVIFAILNAVMAAFNLVIAFQPPHFSLMNFVVGVMCLFAALFFAVQND